MITEVAPLLDHLHVLDTQMYEAERFNDCKVQAITHVTIFPGL